MKIYIDNKKDVSYSVLEYY